MTTEVQIQTIQQFLIKYPVTIELTEVPENPSMEKSKDEMINYYVTLAFEGRMMSLYFSTGLGWVETKKRVPQTPENRAGIKWVPASMVTYRKKSKDFIRTEWGGKRYNADDGNLFSKYRVRKPKVEDVLDCMANDASGVENARNFEDWASEYGYDTDSRKAHATYETIVRQAGELRAVLGHVAYNELLNDTERL